MNKPTTIEEAQTAVDRAVERGPYNSGHRCGLMGYNPMLGDWCPQCTLNVLRAAERGEQ